MVFWLLSVAIFMETHAVRGARPPAAPRIGDDRRPYNCALPAHSALCNYAQLYCRTSAVLHRVEPSDMQTPSEMRPPPTLQNDFIINEHEYQACRAWLADANEETIRHPLDDPSLEAQRQSMKGLVAEYEVNWRQLK